MTVIVGILCKDGVVVGTDSAATFHAGQMRTIEQATKKLEIVADRVIVATTGAGGLGQRFTAVVAQAWQDKLFTKPPLEVGKLLCAAGIKDFSSTGAPKGGFGALVAFPCQHKPHLVEFGDPDFQPELKTENIWYVSMGSGQMIADPFLGLMRHAFWDDGVPNCKDAEFVVTWILSQAIRLNTGGVNGPMQVAVLKASAGNFEARMLNEAELEGHEDNVEGLTAHMRKYRDILRGTAVENAPDVPKPEAAPAAPAAKPIEQASQAATASIPKKFIGER